MRDKLSSLVMYGVISETSESIQKNISPHYLRLIFYLGKVLSSRGMQTKVWATVFNYYK